MTKVMTAHIFPCPHFRLGMTADQREYLREAGEMAEIKKQENCTLSGSAAGDDGFIARLESLTGNNIKKDQKEGQKRRMGVEK